MFITRLHFGERIINIGRTRSTVQQEIDFMISREERRQEKFDDMLKDMNVLIEALRPSTLPSNDIK